MMRKNLFKRGTATTLAVAVALGSAGFEPGVSKASSTSVADAGVATIGTEVADSLSAEDAEDYYKFTTSEDESYYTFTFSNVGTKRMRYTIYSSADLTSGSILKNNDYVNEKQDAVEYLRKLEKNHTYYIKVSPNSTMEEENEYKFTINEVKDDVKDTAAGATEAKVGTEQSGMIEDTADVDVFQFTTDASDSFYKFTFSNVDAPSVRYTVYSGKDMKDSEIVQNANDRYVGNGNTAVSEMRKLSPNYTYYVKVYKGAPKEDGTAGTYKFTVTNSVDDYKGTTAEAAEVKVGTEQTGAIEDEVDVDIFKFTTDASDSYYDLSFSNIDAGSIRYTVYSGEDMKDTEIVNNAKYIYVGNGSTAVSEMRKLTPNHTYYVKVYDAEVGKYKFTVTNVVDDYKGTAAEATEVKAGTEQTGAIEDEVDVDIFKFTTDADDAFYTLTASSIDSASMRYTVYASEDMNEADIVQNAKYVYLNSGETVVSLMGKLTPNHTYYVKVYEAAVGSYKFTVTKTTDDVKDTATDAKKLELNSTTKKNLQDPKDVDVFKFTTSDYTKYALNIANISSERKIYYAIYSDDEFLDTQKVISGGVDLKVASKFELKLERFSTYYIQIWSADGTGQYKVAVNVKAPTVKTTNKKAKKKQVTVKWSKVERAGGYEVYRAVGKSGKYKKIATLKKGNKVSYVDKKGLKKGKTYLYKVRAFKKTKGKNYYSAYSSVKSVKIK